MNKKIGVTGAILGMIAILLGAFAAHGLKEYVEESSLEAFKTGVQYQMYHALVLLFLSTTTSIKYAKKKPIFYCIFFGVLFFSGSLYLLSTSSVTQLDISKFGIITPIGGVLLLISWLLIGFNFLKMRG